jgi:hypothetical protein
MTFVEMFDQMGWFAKLSLLAGFAPMGLAVAYAVRPSERTLALMRPVSLTAIFAGISGAMAGFIAVLRGVAATLPAPAATANVYLGLSEALVPVFMNFGILAGSWLLIAVGMLRRQGAE